MRYTYTLYFVFVLLFAACSRENDHSDAAPAPSYKKYADKEKELENAEAKDTRYFKTIRGDNDEEKRIKTELENIKLKDKEKIDEYYKTH